MLYQWWKYYLISIENRWATQKECSEWGWTLWGLIVKFSIVAKLSTKIWNLQIIPLKNTFRASGLVNQYRGRETLGKLPTLSPYLVLMFLFHAAIPEFCLFIIDLSSSFYVCYSTQDKSGKLCTRYQYIKKINLFEGQYNNFFSPVSHNIQ